MPDAKPCDKITPADLALHPVWTFDLGNEGAPGRDETWMAPELHLPVSDISDSGCLANAVLAGGREILAMVWGIDLTSAHDTERFIRICFWLDGKWWHLSERKFPTGQGTLETYLPTDLAAKLVLPVEQIFPISYDVSAYARGPVEITKGSISGQMRERMTRQEMVAFLQRHKLAAVAKAERPSASA